MEWTKPSSPSSSAREARGSPELLPWTVTQETLVQAAALPPAAAAAPPPPPALSVVDRTSAVIFIHQTLVFERALDVARLSAALAEALALFPTLGCRLTKGEDGEWVLCQPGAGAVLTSGTSSASLKNLVLRPLPPVAPLANLGGQLFGHLPDLPPDGAAAAAVPLLQVACVALEGGGGGGVLGLRLSHMIGDFGTLRALLHHLARAYSGRPLAPADLPVPAAALVEALASVPPPPGAQPWNYVPLLPRIGEMFGPLLAAPPLQGLVLHVPPARLAALKAAASSEAAAAAAAEAAAAGTDGGGGGGDAPQPAWVSTNNALTAWLWRTLATLPCHRGEVSAFYQALGMRGRLPAAAYAGSQAPKPPRWIYGNLAGSAYTPEMDVAEMPLGAVALALRRTIHRDAARFGPDVARMAQGDAAGGPRCSSLTILPVPLIAEAVAAGRRPLMLASQLALDYAEDADFGGQLPVGAVVTFGHVLFPVAHVQPAPPASGGGINVYLWLRPDEAQELREAVAAEQW